MRKNLSNLSIENGGKIRIVVTIDEEAVPEKKSDKNEADLETIDLIVDPDLEIIGEITKDITIETININKKMYALKKFDNLSVILVTGKSEVTQRIEIVEVVLEIVIEIPPDEKVGLQNLLKKCSVKKIRQQGLLK